MLAEEPTAGVDVGARAEIYRILREIADEGTPVVIVSSDMQELEALCDRVIVFSRGHNVGELTGADVTASSRRSISRRFCFSPRRSPSSAMDRCA